MDFEKIFKEETGLDAWIDNNLEPKIVRGYYVEWLEEQIEQLTLTDVSNNAVAVNCMNCHYGNNSMGESPCIDCTGYDKHKAIN